MDSRLPPLPRLRAEELTIAITVYNRREYILKAVASAVNQKPAVRVMVVEDHSPDPGLRDWVLNHFGDQIRYISNPVRRGLFGNWNACLEACETEWISILHDDDYLLPGFVNDLTAFASQGSACGLYFCSQRLTDERENPVVSPFPPLPNSGRHIDPHAFALHLDTLFPGQILHVPSAKTLGGFRSSSQYCGDWEMWHKMACACGARQSASVLAVNRWHQDPSRGTSKVIRLGRKRALEFVQIKRNLQRLDPKNTSCHFDRAAILTQSPASLREILPFTKEMSPRFLRYNADLIRRSQPPNLAYALIRCFLHVFGSHALRMMGRFRMS
jgi:glycosyltransferase involved in cell wall biosynthesis